MPTYIAKQPDLPEVPKHWTRFDGIHSPRIEETPRKVVVRQVEHEPGAYAPYHSHGWGQLLFISEGLIHVSAKDIGFWVVPPQRAVWIPAFTQHDARTIHAVQMRNLYISPDAASELPDHCQVIHITPLLRELILALGEFDTLYDEAGAEGRLVQVFLDRLKTTPEVPLSLPRPSGKILQKIADYLAADPADQRSMEDWATELGTSSRSLARHFRQDTGMTFGQWRQQARLLAALTRIARGDPIANIALDLGYSSQSAFIAMFKKALGKTPGRYFEL
ncbi:AraC family transcriptional regulator [Amphritea balenae]|uniref:AraC family transcriptional regulator n=2 Tax=Amphritea balenae TaxID=452629 RepID=A0A3P1SR88_9GAMM|nr:AraC family transcriptional regulator [Amphritea balenae]